MEVRKFFCNKTKIILDLADHIESLPLYNI